MYGSVLQLWLLKTLQVIQPAKDWLQTLLLECYAGTGQTGSRFRAGTAAVLPL